MADLIKLNQRSTYILPTRAGFFVMIVVILMMIGATNYQNNLAFLLTFLLVGIGLVSIVFTFNNLQGIQLSMRAVNEVFAEQATTIALQVQSQTGKKHFSIALGLHSESLFLCDLNSDNVTEVYLDIEGAKRGYWQTPKLMATSQFPFGWLKTWAYFRFKKPLLVYPEAIEPPSIYQQTSGADENEEGRKISGNEELYGLRPYQAGEPLTRVDWKAFARERGMYIREFAEYKGRQLSFNWADFPNCDNETRLSYLTHLVLDAAHQNLSYALVLPQQSIQLDDGENHRLRCLEALALFELEPVTEPEPEPESRGQSVVGAKS